MTLMKHQQGSMAIALMLGILSASTAFLYVHNTNLSTKQAIDTARLDRDKESNKVSEISGLARFRALVESKKIDDGAYEPAIFPSNYFDGVWTLNANATIRKDVHGPKADFEVHGGSVLLTQTAQVTFEAIQKSFQEGQSPSTAGDAKTIRLLKVNVDQAILSLVASVDVEMTATNAEKVVARIPIRPPVAFNPTLELRKIGESNWIRDFKDLPAGDYEGRVLGSGVVFAAEVTINGQKLPVLGGFGPDGKIAHEAVNPLAKDEEIGRFTYSFHSSVETLGFDAKTCQTTTVDGSVHYEVALISVDQDPKNTTIKRESFHIIEAQLAHELSFEEFKSVCSDQCPYFDGDYTIDLPIRAEQLRTGAYFDYADLMTYDFARARVRARSYKICESIANLGHHAKMDKVPGYLTMPDKELVDLAWERGSLVPGHPGSTMESIAYKPPECKRTFLYAREACGCFAERTRIRLEDGSEKWISELQENDRVWNPVTKKGQAIRRMTRGPETLPLFRIVSQGSEVLVTGTHPFRGREGLIPAFELREGQDIYSVDGRWREVEAIEIKASGSEAPIVWNLELEGPNDLDEAHFVEANGIVTGDLLLQTHRQGTP